MYQKNSLATIQKALYWLNKQDQNWSHHIKDSNIAVKMYLKSQKKESEACSEFQKKLENYCETTCQTKQASQLSAGDLLPPLKQPADKPAISVKKPNEPQNSYGGFELLMPSQSISKPKPDQKADFISHSQEHNSKSNTVSKNPTSLDSPSFINDPLPTKSITLPKENLVTGINSNLKEKTSITLDSKNLEILKDIKKKWNLKTEEEALNLLIQAGQKNLSRLAGESF